MEKYLGDEEITDGRPAPGPADGHHRQRGRARAVRLGVQEQGGPAAARRRRRLPAEPARRPPGAWARRARASTIERHADDAEPVRRPRLQDHDRPLRRQAHLPARLLGHAWPRGRRSSTPPRTARSGWAASCRCTPTTARTRTPSSPATSWPWSGLKHTTTGDTLCDPGHSDPARDPRVPRARHPRGRRAQDQGRPGQAVQGPVLPVARRTPPSGSAPTRRPARRSSRGWASCTSRCSSTGCCGSSPWTPTWASPRWPTARPSASTWRRSRTATSARPAAAASTATSSSPSSPPAPGAATSSWTRSPAGSSRRSTSPPSTPASRRPSRTGCWPATPWWTSGSP